MALPFLPLLFNFFRQGAWIASTRTRQTGYCRDTMWGGVGCEEEEEEARSARFKDPSHRLSPPKLMCHLIRLPFSASFICCFDLLLFISPFCIKQCYTLLCAISRWSEDNKLTAEWMVFKVLLGAGRRFSRAHSDVGRHATESKNWMRH